MEDFLFALSSLIVVIGPWKAGIVFAERTTPLPLGTRRLVAVAAVIIALVIAAVFVLFGENLVEFFHINEAAFLVAAGLLLLVFSIRMVISEGHHEEEVEWEDDAELEDRAWGLAAYPLAIPLIITPPAVATLIALSVSAHVSETSEVALVAAVLAVMGFNLVVFLAEAQWEGLVPGEVWSIAGRVLGVLLAAFGTTILIKGIQASEVLAGV